MHKTAFITGSCAFFCMKQLTKVDLKNRRQKCSTVSSILIYTAVKDLIIHLCVTFIVWFVVVVIFWLVCWFFAPTDF